MREPKPDIDDRPVDQIIEFDDSVAAGESDKSPDESALEELSECLHLIERVRQHSPNCIADMLQGNGVGAMWLDVGAQDPAQIGRFQIRRKLGQGGFGIVFLAFDPELDREVALKVPRFETIVNDETRKRFLREGKAAGSLSHPNIAAVYEAGLIGPISYIVSAYCRGGSLTELLMSGARSSQTSAAANSIVTENEVDLSSTSIASLVRVVAQAVQHAHSRGILHRDLKPSNILFDTSSNHSQAEDDLRQTEGKSGSRHLPAAIDLAKSARIVDFGLAKLLHDDDQHTRTGAMLGTPAYMSPEQTEGKTSRIGPAADIYSLGAILYELLTGKPPHKKPSETETIIAVRNEYPTAPSRIRRTCPKDLEAICLKCLEKEPSRRYATAELLAEDLRSFLRGRPVSVRSPSVANRTWRCCRRYPLAAVFAVLIGALAIIGPIVAVNQTRLYHEAEQSRQDVSRTLYISDMNLAMRDWDEANIERCGELLQRHLPLPGQRDNRGFEWYYLWRLWHQSEQVPVVLHADNLEAMALSTDEKLLALGCHDGTIFLSDRETGRKLRQWQAHPYGTFSLAFSRNGKTLVSASVDNEVKLWDVATNRVLAKLPGSRAVAFSPVDGTIAYRTNSCSIAILDEGQAKPRVIKDAHGVGVGCVAFSPNGNSLASAGWDGTVQRWDVATIDRQIQMDGHDHMVWSLDWSPDGRFLATGDVYGTIKLWDASTGAELRSMDGHNATIRSLAFAPDSATLVSASADNTVKVWKVPTGWELRRLRGHYGDVTSIAFADNGKRLLSASSDGDVKSWNLATTSYNDVLVHPEAATSVVFSHDNQLVATSCSDGFVRLWKSTTGELLHSIDAHTGGAWRVRFLMLDGRATLVSTGKDGVIRLWDLDSRTVIREFACRSNSLDPVPVAISPDESKLAFADTDITLKIWDVVRNIELNRLTVGTADDLKFSTDGRTLGVASGKFVSLWDVAGGDQLSEVSADSRYVICVAFSPDGQTLASGCFDRTVKLWSIGYLSGDQEHSYRILKGPAASVTALAYSPDGSVLASGGGDQVVRLWDPVSGRQRVAFAGHSAAIVDLAFSPDGKVLASAGDDFKVQLWRTASKDTVPQPQNDQ